MSSKSVPSVALLLSLNLLFFSMVSSNTLAPDHVSPSRPSKCPNLHICAKVLVPPYPASGCCPLIQGLVDVDAAVCLCAALKADIGGIIQLPLNIAVNIILSLCGHKATNLRTLYLPVCYICS
ncbi:putative lipid-binding protein AIR1B, partial [Mucuna pruriens]